MIDDSSLLHYSQGYDPVKARQYYLRTRQLKGRSPGQRDRVATGVVRSTPSKGKKKSSRREEIQAQKAALEKRLDRLRDVLAELVEAAKTRSGVDTKSDKSEKKSSEKEPQKKRKLTAKEKREAAERSKEHREKNEKKQPPSKEIKELQAQIKDIRKQIKEALEDARKKKSRGTITSKTAPKGR